jgi:uncharacterized protein YbbC (DUF1343 family)
MKFSFFFILALAANLAFSQTQYVTENDIEVGATQFEEYASALSGKKVAITGNHTSMIGEMHVVDFLLEKGVTLTKVFAPEHGFRGKADAGEKVESGKDSKTGLPIVSLYGSHKKPTVDDLKGIDIMLFDIQDVGARFYTYISTMTYVMEACAENNIPVIVLDRPNPHGFYIDGPVLKSEHKSFVGMLEIPVIHGMTVGELAQMINGENWLENGVQCQLTVIPVKEYSHNDIYVLPVKPSPNLPTQNAILLYPSLCFFEGTVVSVGRGTDKPFEIFGHPNFPQGSAMFVPKPTDGAKHPKHEGVPCAGWDLTEFGGKRIQEAQALILDWIVNAYRDFPNQDKFFLKNGFFEKLAGTDVLRQQIERGLTADQIRASWSSELGAFNAKRKKYLLYEDFE